MATRPYTESPRTAQPGTSLVVVHEFVARSADELSLKKGDRIELIERDDDFGDGWYLGRHLQTGNTGLFPEVYTTVAPKTAPQRGPALGTADAIAKGAVGQALNEPTTSGAAIPTSTNGDAASSDGYIQSGARSPSSSGQIGTPNRASNHSAVMNETLSVIDEHITDLNKPGLGTQQRSRRASNYSNSSDYSPNPTSRASYIQGEETDEEEELNRHTEEEVLRWSPSRVAEYLEKNGVEPSHCKVFQEQEFSGEVLLGMDQSSIFLKELDLGPIGRRLRTWQKIKSLQDEVKATTSARMQRASELGSGPVSPGSSKRSSVVNLNTYRGMTSVAGESPTSRQQELQNVSPSISTPHSPRRPSAASVRSLGHSRRQSSIDQAVTDPTAAPHNKQASLDQSWTMTGSSIMNNNQNSTLRPSTATHMHSWSSDRPQFEKASRDSSVTAVGLDENDRGYVSGGDLDVPRQRKLHRKRDDPNRHSSYDSTSKKRSSLFGRSSGQESPITKTDIESPVQPEQDDSNARVVSEPIIDMTSGSVTKLDYGNDGTKARTSMPPDQPNDGLTATSRTGLRALSDAITGRERALAKLPVDQTNAVPSSPTRTESSTPSATSNSMDKDELFKAKLAAAGTFPVGTLAKRNKQKKQTSAYMRGLEKRSPKETVPISDYSGWMKKKSTNLMTTWKPRLFVLRGRRLAYYYSEDDTEEKGLIDISSHRVLPADNERITGLHAALTGATASPTSPKDKSNSASTSPIVAADGTPASATTNSSNASPIMITTPFTPSKEQGFIFKLVPPRMGLTKAVNFTKPTVHYFWVPNVQEGRMWMAALMKATIDKDESMEVITTYQQKTISLAKARARKERPPALMEDEEPDAADGEKTHTLGDDDKTEVGAGEYADSTTEVKPQDTTEEDKREVVDGADLEKRSQDQLQASAGSQGPSSVSQAPNENSVDKTNVDDSDENRDQITEVTNLESTPEGEVLNEFQQSNGSKGSRSDSTRKRTFSLTGRGFRSNSASRQSSSGQGLGIGGLDGKSTPEQNNSAETSPIMDRLSNAGLW